ncbi:hypothetical protein [Senegalia massiliensis]|uniref:hypothetical protein n=1 Tax=Senegalia massiliensis TaxID=1720316 RepID=UPI001363F6AF|nr:hypothetical protein [Senegalia massiliensis]
MNKLISNFKLSKKHENYLVIILAVILIGLLVYVTSLAEQSNTSHMLPYKLYMYNK